MIPADRIVDVVQGSPEWFAARAGKVTGSRIDAVLAKGKGSAEAVTRRDYRAQIVAEILTGQSQERQYENDDMRWGKEQEPFAAAAYELAKGVLLDTVGFVRHPVIGRAGCSPDRVCGPAGLVQIKCPKTATHIRYMLEQEIPGDHLKQMHWEMACTGAAWCDFVSFDPRMPERLQLYVQRVVRDPATITSMEVEVQAFLAGVEQQLASLEKLAA